MRAQIVMSCPNIHRASTAISTVDAVSGRSFCAASQDLVAVIQLVTLVYACTQKPYSRDLCTTRNGSARKLGQPLPLACWYAGSACLSLTSIDENIRERVSIKTRKVKKSKNVTLPLPLESEPKT